MIQGLTFHDPEPLSGLNYYMVRAVKLVNSPSGSYYNLSTGITDSVSVILGKRELAIDFKIQINVFPNPAQDQIFMRFNENVHGTVIITITDIMGKEIREMKFSDIQKNDDFSITLEHIDPGMYFISAKTEEFLLVRKFEIRGY